MRTPVTLVVLTATLGSGEPAAHAEGGGAEFGLVYSTTVIYLGAWDVALLASDIGQHARGSPLPKSWGGAEIVHGTLSILVSTLGWSEGDVVAGPALGALGLQQVTHGLITLATPDGARALEGSLLAASVGFAASAVLVAGSDESYAATGFVSRDDLEVLTWTYGAASAVSALTAGLLWKENVPPPASIVPRVDARFAGLTVAGRF